MKSIKHFLLLLALLLGHPLVSTLSSQTLQEQQHQKEEVVYITDTGEKYHGINCGYLHSSKKAIELSKAVASGYTPCSRCEGSNSYYPQTQSSSTSVQCSGTTQKGARCRRMTTNPNGRCYQH